MAADEVATRQQFNAHFSELLLPTIASRGGRIVKTMGDGLLAEFTSVVEAVACAETVLTSMSDRNREQPNDRRFDFRIGINLGDVIVEGDDIHGDGVNIAARLESIADPGTVYLSQEVFAQISGKTNGEITALGEQSLKNIGHPVSVFRLDPMTEDDPERFRTGIRRPPASADRPSIAVLPFQNRSDDQDGDYFAEGVAEDILAALSRIGWLFVIARSTSFIYTANDRDPRGIAAELGLTYVLDGSVRRGGSRVRVSVELVDGISGRQLWAARYDRELADLFEIQDEIAETISGEIQPELARSEQERARSKRGESLRAWDLHQRAMWHSWRRTHADMREAIRLFTAARDEDPSFAPAFAGEAEVLGSMFVRGFSRDEEDVLSRGHELSQQAVALDPRDAYAHFSAGYTLMFQRRHSDAIPAFGIALDLNPNFAQAYGQLGNALATSGKAEEGIKMIERSMRLSPRDHLIGQKMTRLAEALLFAGRPEEALLWSRRALQQPNIQASRWTTLLTILGNLGRADEAVPALEALMELNSNHTSEFIRRRYPIVHPPYMDLFLTGLTRAGVP